MTDTRRLFARSADFLIMDPFEIYGFARIDDWLAAHESFAKSLDAHKWLGGLIGIYRDRVLAVRGEVTIRRAKHEPIENPRMQVLIGYVDSMTQEIEKMQSDVELGRIDEARRQAQRLSAEARGRRKEIVLEVKAVLETTLAREPTQKEIAKEMERQGLIRKGEKGRDYIYSLKGDRVGKPLPVGDYPLKNILR